MEKRFQRRLFAGKKCVLVWLVDAQPCNAAFTACRGLPARPGDPRRGNTTAAERLRGGRSSKSTYNSANHCSKTAKNGVLSSPISHSLSKLCILKCCSGSYVI